MIGHWPVHTKPMLPAGSYVTSLGCLYIAIHDVKCKQSQSALHSTWRTEDVFLEKKKNSSVSINAEKTNNAPNYSERLKVPTVLMVMFNMQCNILLICATWTFDFVVILCLYRNGQLFEYHHFKIISHYCFHINCSFVLSYYNTTQNMYDTYFLSIESVTLFIWQYAPNTRNWIRTKQDWKTLNIG